MMNFNSVSRNGIYIDIACIMDIRLRTLHTIDETYNSEVLVKSLTVREDGMSYYNGRLVDEFDFIGKDMFKLFLGLETSTNTLQDTYLTKLSDLVTIDILNIKNTLGGIDNSSPVEIVINYFPFDLDTNAVNYLERVFNTLFTLGNVSIVMTTVCPTELDLATLDGRYFSVYMYEGLDWLEYAIANSNDGKVTAPSLKLNVPALFHSPIDTGSDVSPEDIFKTTKEASSMLVDLNFVPIEYFNYDIKKIKR